MKSTVMRVDPEFLQKVKILAAKENKSILSKTREWSKEFIFDNEKKQPEKTKKETWFFK